MNTHSIYGNLSFKGGENVVIRAKTSFRVETVQNVQLAKGIVKFGNYHLSVYCFIIDGLLIDTGPKTLASHLRTFFSGQDLDQVVITHHHEDHTGNAAFLQKQMGLSIFMRPEKMIYCQEKEDYPFYRKVFWGRRDRFEATELGDSLKSRTYSWEVIHTPGHAEDHVSLLNKDTGQLFTGDLYCGERTRVILREESISKIIASIEKVLLYEFSEIYCSHLGYVKNGRRALKLKLEYLKELQENILDLIQEGRSEKEISKILFPKKYPIEILSFGEYSAKNIVRSVINDYYDTDNSLKI